MGIGPCTVAGGMDIMPVENQENLKVVTSIILNTILKVFISVKKHVFSKLCLVSSKYCILFFS